MTIGKARKSRGHVAHWGRKYEADKARRAGLRGLTC